MSISSNGVTSPPYLSNITRVGCGLMAFTNPTIITLYVHHASRYASVMIQSFKCRETEMLFKGTRMARFANIERVALRKLEQLDFAACVEDMRAPPGNRLEALSGKRSGQWSVRVNDQWRVCFRFEGGAALDVEIVDYH